MMSIRGIIACSAAVLLVALSSAVEVYDDLLPARLETDMAYQDSDLDLQGANHAHSRLNLQKTDELQSRNFKDVMNNDPPQTTNRGRGRRGQFKQFLIGIDLNQLCDT